MLRICKRIMNSISSWVIFLFLVGSFIVLQAEYVLPIIGLGILTIALIIMIYNFIKLSRKEKALIKQSIRHPVKDKTFYNKLGKIYTETGASRVKIVMVSLLHTLILVYAVGMIALLTARRNGKELGADAIVLLILAVVLGLRPLRHWNEYIQYYEKGFCFSGYIYLYQEVGEPEFTNVEGFNMIGGLLMRVKGDCIDLSYLKNAKKKYVKAYMNCAKDTL